MELNQYKAHHTLQYPSRHNLFLAHLWLPVRVHRTHLTERRHWQSSQQLETAERSWKQQYVCLYSEILRSIAEHYSVRNYVLTAVIALPTISPAGVAVMFETEQIRTIFIHPLYTFTIRTLPLKTTFALLLLLPSPLSTAGDCCCRFCCCSALFWGCGRGCASLMVPSKSWRHQRSAGGQSFCTQMYKKLKIKMVAKNPNMMMILAEQNTKFSTHHL